MEKKLNYFEVSAYLVLAFVSALGMEIVFNKIAAYIPGWLIAKANTSEFSGILWQVEASISLLSITFVALLLYRIDSRFFGVSIKDRLFYKKRGIFLNYWEKIVLSIMLTFFNYYFVIMEKFNASVFVFFVNCAYIILIFIATFEVINDDMRIKAVIREKLIKCIELEIKKAENACENDSHKISENAAIYLDGIHKQAIFLMKENNTVAFNENMEILYEIMELSYREADRKSDSVFYTTQEIVVNIIKETISIGKINEAYRNVMAIIKVKSSEQLYEETIFLSLKALVESIREFKTEKQVYEIDIYRLINDELFNRNSECLISDEFEVSRLYTMCFINIYENIYINDMLKIQIVKGYLDRFVHFSFANTTGNYVRIKKLALYSILKYFFRKAASEEFGMIISALILQNRLGVGEISRESWSELLSASSVYIYYIVEIEDYFDLVYKQNIRRFMDATNEENIVEKPCIREFIINSKGNILRNFSNIYSQLTQGWWEVNPINMVSRAKMHDVVCEFMAFYTLRFYEDYEMRDFSAEGVADNLISTFLQYFNENGELKGMHHKSYEAFCSLWRIENGNKILNPALAAKLRLEYKRRYIARVHNEAIKKDIIAIKIEECKQVIEDKLNLEFSDIKTTLEGSFEERNVTLNIHISSFSIENSNYIMEAQKFVQAIESDIYSRLDSSLEKIITSFEETEKINKVAVALKRIRREHKAKMDSFLGHKLSEEGLFTSNETKKKLEYLRRYESKLRQGSILKNNNTIVLIDSTKLKVNIEIIEVQVRNYTDEEINSFVKEAENMGQITVDEIGIKVKFTSEEYSSYLRESDKVAIVIYRLKVEAPLGAGIIIQPFGR